jgi:GTP-binding protein Era
MNIGTVLLLGRTNAGKSTLLNQLIGQKVAITTRKPQTTRFPIRAVFEDERGQIVFTDTPGIFAKSPDLLAKKVSKLAQKSFRDSADLVIYLVDHTRYRDTEENKTLGKVRKIEGVPKLLVFNKWDIKEPSYYAKYKFLEEEFKETIKISALKGTNVKTLLETIFSYLPETEEKILETKNRASPLLDIDSKLFLEEIIREKAFNQLGQELPYTITVKIEQVEEREDGTLYVKANILTTHDRYKAMIIGRRGQKIKEIGTSARKELELARNKKVYLELNVKTDPNWMQTFSY